MSEWGLPKAVAKALGEEGFCSKAALLGLTEEDICSFELKKGEMAALRTAVGQLQAEGGGGPLVPKTATPAPSRRPSVLLHDLLTTNADGVDIGARATAARVDLDPQFCLHKASGEAKPHLITALDKTLIAKCRCQVACLKSFKYRLSRKSQETMYRSFILPQLDYADVVWDNCSLKLAEDLE